MILEIRIDKLQLDLFLWLNVFHKAIIFRKRLLFKQFNQPKTVTWKKLIQLSGDTLIILHEM
jgi:hypothetical protein